MRKKSLPFAMGILAIIFAINMMFFILKTTSISRITSISFQEAIAQNSVHVWAMLLSSVGLFLFGRYQQKVIQEKNEKKMKAYKKQAQE